MFFYQFKNSIQNLLHPVIGTTTRTIQKTDIKVKPPLITICPLDQFNETKMKNLGYESREDLLSGLKKVDNTTQLTWGSDLNKTFDQTMEEVLNYSIEDMSDLHVEEIVDGNPIPDSYNKQLKRKFYIGFLGYCWELQEYNISTLISIYMNSSTGRDFEVFVTIKDLNTFYSIDTDSNTGLLMMSDKKFQTWYQIQMKIFSDKDPKDTEKCEDYRNNQFEKCIDGKIQSYVKPIIGCNPPWFSTQDTCRHTNKTLGHKTKEMYEKKIPPLLFRNSKLEKSCTKPCVRYEFDVRIKAYITDMQHAVLISFLDDVPYTQKYLTYDFSNFLIDIGSSLGLWFGVSVFGLTDIGILVINFIKRTDKKTILRKVKRMRRKVNKLRNKLKGNNLK